MSQGDERLDDVQDRIEHARQAAARVEDVEDVPADLTPDSADDGRHDTFEPTGDDSDAGRLPELGRPDPT
jgi:hypothetical protein